MSSSDDQRLGDLEAGEGDALTNGASTTPTRSIYSMTRDEIAKNIANRFVHSGTYIMLYLGMAALSITTVVLSLVNDCPTLAFYVLEFIINAAMILEVGIRFVAFGRQFWKSLWNIMDLVMTAFCVITILFIFFAGCGNTSKEEELLDTLLLVARNVLQFGRLASVMRQSGQSIFTRPKPIDLSAARRRGYTLDIDMEDEEDAAAELGRPLMRSDVVFDAADEQPQQQPPRTNVQRANALPEMPRAAQAAQERDAEDMWAELG